MKDLHQFGTFLMSDKEGVSFEEFYRHFKRKEFYYSIDDSGNTFEDFLHFLYEQNKKEYKLWHSTFIKEDYKRIKNNLPIITEIFKDGKANRELVKIVLEMAKRRQSIVSRHSFKFVEKYFESDMQLSVTDIDQEVINNCKQEFVELFGNSNNFYLKCACLNNLQSIEKELLEFIKAIFNKIKAANERDKSCNVMNFISDRMVYHAKKKHIR